MNANEINSKKTLLKYSINQAIINSVHSVIKKSQSLGNTPQEPDYIASLTLEFTPALLEILKLVFPKNKFTVTGIFCHQKPIVDIKLDKSPEIGDILLVYIHTDTKGNKIHNSLLLQAKITQRDISKVSFSDSHQLELYKKWPDFTYKRADSLNGTSRSILPKTFNDGAQYLLIDNHPIIGSAGLPGTFPMGCAQPQEYLYLDNDLASEIIEFLKFKSGRIFEEDPKSTNDDWTKMIWDIIEITKNKASRRRNSGLNNFPRQTTSDSDGLYFIKSESNTIFNELLSFDSKNDKLDNDDSIGLSTIIIESTNPE